jgi:hypothetical protein
MTEKKSLHDALHNLTINEKNIKEEKIMNEKNRLTFEIYTNAHLQLDQMKRDLRRKSMTNLVIEAFNDLFTKYGYPPIA